MNFMLDMVSPPNRGQATAMRQLGWNVLAAYIGGPRATAGNAWHQQDGILYPVRDLADIFDGFMPIFVGRNTGPDARNPWDPTSAFTFQNGQMDGDQANSDTGACGFGPNTPIVLDLEYGTYQAHPTATRQYVAGFVERANEAGHVVYLYTDRQAADALDDPTLIDGLWVAQWIKGYQGARNLASISLPAWLDPATPPPWAGWQFGGGTVAGVSVDYNTLADDTRLASYG